MTLGYAAALRNTQLDAITTRAGNAAKLKIFSGTRPATGGSETTKLAELICATPFAAGASGGLLTLGAITSDASADATGIATWFRIESSGGTHVLDGSVGASGSGADLILSTTSIVSGATVAVTAASITRGNA
jgi:hypothetical protein